MMGLTSRQAELLAFIKAEVLEGRTPSVREMSAKITLVKSGVHRLLTALEERGHIRRIPNRARAIEVIEAGSLERFSNASLFSELRRRGYNIAACPPPHFEPRQ